MNKFSKGFTLIETIAVLMLMGILATVTLPAITRGTAGAQARLCRDQLYRDIRAARAEAIGKEVETSVGFGAASYTLDLGGGEPVERILPKGFVFASVQLNAGAEKLIFDPNGQSNGARIELAVADRSFQLRVKEDGGLAWE